MMKTISVEISTELDRRLRVTAASMDLNRSEFIRQALEEKLAALEPKPQVEGSHGSLEPVMRLV